jgi:AcrR family transcriptional regulator
LPPEQKLRQAMQAYLDVLIEYHDLAAVLLLEHRSLEPEYRSRHIPRRDRFERMWRDLIQQGMDEGDFCCADPALTARALLGVMNWTITWLRPGGTLTSQMLTDHFAEMFLHGLLPRPEDV